MALPPIVIKIMVILIVTRSTSTVCIDWDDDYINPLDSPIPEEVFYKSGFHKHPHTQMG